MDQEIIRAKKMVKIGIKMAQTALISPNLKDQDNRDLFELALLGLILAVVAFWLYTQVMKQDYSAWMMTVIFNIIAIFLYATGYNWPGVALSIIVLLYFINPGTKVHFENR